MEDLKKENFKPVRTERSGNLRVVVNDLAGRKSKEQSTCVGREERFGASAKCRICRQAFKKNINSSTSCDVLHVSRNQDGLH